MLPEDKSSKAKTLDHSKLGPVFVNKLAAEAIQIKSSSFPEGSVIVREKLSKPGDAKPQLLAVMIKREHGFNPDGGDWQFLLINGAGNKVKQSQKTGACLNCHNTQAKTDYVYPLK